MSILLAFPFSFGWLYLDKATSLVALYKRSKEPILLDEADRCQAKAEALLELLGD